MLCQAIQEIETQLAEDLKLYQSRKNERKDIKRTLPLQKKIITTITIKIRFGRITEEIHPTQYASTENSENVNTSFLLH